MSSEIDVASYPYFQKTLLINNAGVMSSSNVLTMSPEELDADFRTNVHGTLAAIKAFLPVLERAPKARRS